MSSRQNEKKSSKIMLGVIIGFTVIVLIVAFLATMTYNKIAKTNIESNETETLVTFAANMANYTDARFTAALNRLDGYAMSFSGADDMSDEEIVKGLERCITDETFASIAYVCKDGRTCIGGKMDLNPRIYAAEALTGNNVVVPTEKLYAVPVEHSDGTICGALVGISGNVSVAHNDYEVFGVSGTSYILDDAGNVVSAPENAIYDFRIGENMVTHLATENNMNDLKTALSQKSVRMSQAITHDNSRFVLAAASLQSLDWTVVTLVPYSAVIAHSENVITPMNGLIFGLTIVFLILAAYLIYFTLKMRKRTVEIAEENNKINYIDDITGYASWKSFTENYEKIRLDTGTNRAFIALDIDKFKTINDTIGYEGGNKVLKQVAEIIARDIGNADIFARNGGDHFIILAEYKDKDEIIGLVKNIISDIEYQITDIKVTVSIGICLIDDYSRTIRAVLDRANIARSTIKNLGESRFTFFDNSMIENIREEKSIENIMEDSLEKGEFVVYLQPKYGLEEDNETPSGEVIGAEALVRWYHDGKIISPGKFIPIFEKNGFVTKLDFYMFREVCKLQKTWKNMGYTPKVISVNMSRLHFPDPHFVDTLKGICDEYGIDTKYFEIEVTESAAYENINILMDVFSKIKAAGFHVSIDDFGTGYSSLNMLKDLPVDVLKIDRSFLTEDADEEENASKIIACVVSLASSLDISTICEGIETKEQANLLSKLGCDMAQGFYFARPMPVKDFEKLVYGTEE